MYIAASLTKAKRWEQPKCPSMAEWINEVYTNHRISLNLELEGDPSHATTWTSLEDIMSSKINQPQKDNHCMIPLL